MTPITIDAEDLVMAFENHDAYVRHFLDRESGNVFFIHEDYSDEEDRERLEIEPDRYVLIEPLRSSASYQIMQDFADTLPRGTVQAELTLALEEHRPFRRFKDTLSKYPSARDDWFRFHERAVLTIARVWLAAHQVDAVAKRMTAEGEEPLDGEGAGTLAGKDADG